MIPINAYSEAINPKFAFKISVFKNTQAAKFNLVLHETLRTSKFIFTGFFSNFASNFYFFEFAIGLLLRSGIYF